MAAVISFTVPTPKCKFEKNWKQEPFFGWLKL